MRHVLLSLVVVALALGSLGVAAAAEREVTVTPVEFTIPTPLTFGPTGVPFTCQVGNLNPSAWAINSFVVPPEDYKLAFDPLATCTVCQLGFRVTSIHAFLQSRAACTIVMSVDVEEAVYQGANCPAPGTVLCSGALYQVNLPAAGLWNINLPVTCDCLTPGREYLLGVHFESATCNPDLITDAGPAVACHNWNNYGNGWYDLVGAFPTWPGQIKFFADTDCCTPPVPAEQKSWGAVKELYDE
jgi:hypothetical protein